MLNTIYGRENILKENKSIQEDIDDFKTPQPIGGYGIILYTTQTNDTWDVLNANINTAGLSSTWRVTFTPTNPNATYAELGVNYLYHSTATGYEYLYYWSDPSTSSSIGTKSWIIYTLNNTASSELLNLKFQVKASSQGSISWVRLTS